jgi:hypothetical protein
VAIRNLEHDATDLDFTGVRIDIDRSEGSEFSPADAGLDRDQHH